jgi:hypothetical protein
MKSKIALLIAGALVVGLVAAATGVSATKD